jgi:2-polyprenyl-3-methyl-5-hydroxy-6-metoxy-1,4-benzoquinol methylase
MNEHPNHEKVKSFFAETSIYINNKTIITLRKEIIYSIIGDIKDSSIIDVGCGNGEVSLKFIHNNKVTFVDLSKEMLDEVAKRISHDQTINSSLINSSIEDLPDIGKFNHVICLGVLAHAPNVQAIVNKLKELLSTNGMLYIQFSDHSKILATLLSLKKSLVNRFKKSRSYKTNKTTFNQINKLIKQNNLKIINNISYFPVLPFMRFLPIAKQLHLIKKLSGNRYFSKFGSERILMIQHKDAHL